MSIRYSERLAENDIVASVGSTGDSYDNAMAEARSLFKWEPIYPQGPWKGLDDVDYATMGYLDWFNHRRLHGEITKDNGYVTPEDSEAASNHQNQPVEALVTKTPEKQQNPGRLSLQQGFPGVKNIPEGGKHSRTTDPLVRLS